MDKCNRCGDELDWDNGEEYWADTICRGNDHVPLCVTCSDFTFWEHRENDCEYS